MNNNKELKYQVLWERDDDYSFQKQDKEIVNFDTIGEALKFATNTGYIDNFKIVRIIQYDLLDIKEK